MVQQALAGSQRAYQDVVKLTARLSLARGLRLEDAHASDDFVLPNLVDHEL